MERWEAKVIAMFATFGVIFTCMSLPIKVGDFIHARGEKAGAIMSVLRCFGGGVFLGTILLHMLPEVQEMVRGSITEQFHIDYPLPEVIIAAGFFLICFFEKIVMSIHKQRRRSKQQKKSMLQDEEAMVPSAQVMLTGHYPVGENGNDNGTPAVMSEVIHCVDQDYFSDNNNKQPVQPHQQVCSVAVVSQNKQDRLRCPCSATIPANKVKLEQMKVTDKEPDNDGVPQARSIILLMALSFECIFDGLGVGLQNTTGGVWNIFIAVISHESIVSFCLGLELLKFHSKKKVVLAAFIYAMIPPIGNVIGIIITETHNVAEENTVIMVNGVLLGVAAGIFLYCTFIGMMGEELIEHSTYKKVVATMLGCGLMAGLAAVPEADTPELTQSYS